MNLQLLYPGAGGGRGGGAAMGVVAGAGIYLLSQRLRSWVLDLHTHRFEY